MAPSSPPPKIAAVLPGAYTGDEVVVYETGDRKYLPAEESIRSRHLLAEERREAETQRARGSR